MTNSYIFLAGASRGVGREIANCLTAQNLPIEAIWYLFLKYKGFRKADLRSPATIEPI